MPAERRRVLGRGSELGERVVGSKIWTWRWQRTTTCDEKRSWIERQEERTRRLEKGAAIIVFCFLAAYQLLT
jgi:hypothetical protein